jgi:hypothetical protein
MIAKFMPRTYVQVLVVFAACMAVSGALHAASFLVDNLNNGGTGTLRAAIESANVNPGFDTIDFDAGLNGTIVLSSGLPQLTDDVEISGPGADVITVSGNSLHRPFFVSSGSTATLRGLTIANGRSSLVVSGGTGGAIQNEGNLTVIDCVLSNNHAEFDGGAIRNVDGSLVVNHSTLSNNTVGESGVGAGISNAGTGIVEIKESTLTANIGAYYGGAVDNEGTITIVRSTLSNNAALIGGASSNVGALHIRNSTISGNEATAGSGAIDNYAGEAHVEFSTLQGNFAGSFGSIANNASITFKNSLVVNSVAGVNCVHDAGGTFTSLGVSFATDTSCLGFTQATEGEINLGPLEDNGGPTQTHALQVGSVALDAALDCTLIDGSTPVTRDQRGQGRPVGADCDSGAFEFLPAVIFRDGFEGG